jgi:tRNA modification GTPase
VEERVRLGGVTMRLIDTAGIRETEDRVEKLGVERSLSAAENAALVLAVVDGSREEEEGTAKILQTAERAEHAIVVISKSDLPRRLDTLKTSLPQLHLSSLNGEGLKQLEEMIATMFPAPSVPAGEILTNARQAEAVKRACESMDAALAALEAGSTPDIVLTETEAAMEALGELTGTSVRSDITDRIFSRFCVGK